MNPEAPKLDSTCVGYIVDGDEKRPVYGNYALVMQALQSAARIERERPRITISFGGFYVVPE